MAEEKHREAENPRREDDKLQPAASPKTLDDTAEITPESAENFDDSAGDGSTVEMPENPDETVGASAVVPHEKCKVSFEVGGRKIDETGGFGLEIVPDRTYEDIRDNRPGNNLREKILSLPEQPGVYMYLDRHGNVIYVGKAKRLKRRVSSYFNRRHDVTRTNLLVRNIVDMRFIVVASEEEALHLENAMIKEYQPRYNVLLKDDKSYPWIVVTNELYPRVFMTRERTEKGKYYGPYTNVQSAKTVLQLIRDIYPLRSCRHPLTPEIVDKGKLRLCLDFHIGKCGGACRGMITPEAYSEHVSRVRRILNGDTVELENRLHREMEALAADLRFEEAAQLKEKYLLVKKYNAKSVIPMVEKGEQDVFAYLEDGDFAYVNFMHLHNGAVTRSMNLEYRRRLDETREEILSMAVAEIMRRFECSFTRVLVPFKPDVEFEGVRFTVPQRGTMSKMLAMAEKNVRQYMADKEKLAEKLNPDHAADKLMERMKTDFRMPVEPRHIECFDNSNIQGTNPVASCVVFRNGKPSKKDYRHFMIKTVVGADDFASMKEVLHRRYSRMMAEGEKLPDMVIVDGGKGQLSSAVEAFDEMGIRGKVTLVGIAKRLEEIYFPGDTLPLYIDKKSPSLRVVQHLRDEAHRFGITHHRLRRSKTQTVSALDSVKGIGPATSAALMRHFKSLKRLREASEDEITEVVGPAKARILRDAFTKQ